MAGALMKLIKELEVEWKKSGVDRNLPKIGTLIDNLQAESIKSQSFMTPKFEKEHQTNLLLQRDLLEYSALYAIENNDMSAFENAIGQLKHYYNELKALDTEVAESPKKYQMIGLYLMYLLATNRLPQFHLVLESLPPEMTSNNMYISLPVNLEQFLVVGNYNMVFLSSKSVPEPHYTYFMNKLLDTTRDQIGSCIEKAYSELKYNDAARLLFMGDSRDALKTLHDFAAKRQWHKEDREKKYMFRRQLAQNKPAEDPVVKFVIDNLFYAKQLEKIV